MTTPTSAIEELASREYQHGFYTDIETDTVPPGLNEETVRLISAKKQEPDWLLEWRLKAYRHWLQMEEPRWWPNVTFGPIDYQGIRYYSAPKQKKELKNLDEVDPELRRTFERLGISLDEQKRLTGVAVDAVFDSVSVATTFKDKLAELGIIFCSFSEAVREHPELVRKYLGSVVPYNDNYFAALNSAVFSDGSFCYIPKGVRCPMELSTYFRINAAGTGQFERTLIVAEEGAYVSYLEGCHPAGEQVSTPAGWANIESIKPGDYVYDHEGRTRKVRAVMVRQHRGEMLTVRPMAKDATFRLTPEHPVLAIKCTTGIQDCLGEVGPEKLLAKAEWVKARELVKGDLVLMPKVRVDDRDLSGDLEVASHCGTFADVKKWDGARDTATHFLVPILEVTRESWANFVFNLDVEESHSYLVRGVAVHNCTAPQRDENQLHAAVVELAALGEGSQIKYSTVQNWYPGDKEGRGGIYNFVTKRGACRGRGSKISWTQVETGSAITWKYPSVILQGEESVGEFYSVALTKGKQQADTGTKMIHIGKNTRSTIVSKGISAGQGQNTYRGLVKVLKGAAGSRNYSQCDSLLIGDQCGAHTFPYIEVKNTTSQVEHEASTSKIGEDQIFYCRQRGLSAEDAVGLIVNGFCKEVFRELPMEFAVEAQKLLGVSLEGSVG